MERAMFVANHGSETSRSGARAPFESVAAESDLLLHRMLRQHDSA